MTLGQSHGSQDQIDNEVVVLLLEDMCLAARAARAFSNAASCAFDSGFFGFGSTTAGTSTAVPLSSQELSNVHFVSSSGASICFPYRKHFLRYRSPHRSGPKLIIKSSAQGKAWNRSKRGGYCLCRLSEARPRQPRRRGSTVRQRPHAGTHECQRSGAHLQRTVR